MRNMCCNVTRLLEESLQLDDLLLVLCSVCREGGKLCATHAVRHTERSTQQPEATYVSRASTVYFIVQNVTDVGC